jgi:ribose transport system ATP-binding protein
VIPAAPDSSTSQHVARVELREIHKQFGGVHALRGASVSIHPGEVHGLLGENGSGKSTLIKVLAGYHVPDAGRLAVDGRGEQLPPSAERLAGMGIAFVHQDLGLINSLSVTENLWMRELSVRKGAFVSWSREHERTRETLARYGLEGVHPTQTASTLSAFQRAMLAIARAIEGIAEIAGEGRGLLVLDEAMAFLADHERSYLSGIVGDLTATGAAVLLVTHDLDDALKLCDRITVLRDGEVAGTVAAPDTSPQELARLITGGLARTSGAADRRTESRPDRVLATVECPGVSGLSLRIGAGEIVGVTGLAGEAFGQIPYLLYGALPAASGQLTLDGKTFDVRRHSPDKSLAAGIVLVPGDRQRQGAVGSLTVQENMLIPRLSEFMHGPLLSRRAMSARGTTLIRRYDVRPPYGGAVMSTLSGGNQQKAIVAKWLQLSPALLLLDEPTIGVDVGSRVQIFEYIRKLASGGTAVLCSSVDYAQLATLCDRVLIFSRGVVVDELVGPQVTKDEILTRCLLQPPTTT